MTIHVNPHRYQVVVRRESWSDACEAVTNETGEVVGYFEPLLGGNPTPHQMFVATCAANRGLFDDIEPGEIEAFRRMTVNASGGTA